MSEASDRKAEVLAAIERSGVLAKAVGDMIESEIKRLSNEAKWICITRCYAHLFEWICRSGNPSEINDLLTLWGVPHHEVDH